MPANKHFSEIIRDQLFSWAISKSEKELVHDRAKSIIDALEANAFVVIHNEVINGLIKEMDKMERQNQELATLLKARSPEQPAIIRPN